MRFNEVELDDGDIAWLIRKDSCLHCDDPGCLAACPAPGAIVQYTNGIVNFDQTKCIGCQYCVSGCPFDIPRFDNSSKKVYKCTLCIDRVSASLEPACVKACPTGAIKFGGKAEMLGYANAKVEKLKARGFKDALVYDPSGVGGLHMMYVVPRGDRLKDYGLPEDPQVPGNFFSALGVLRKLGSISVLGGLLATGIFWLRTGRHRPPPEDEAVLEAERLGQEDFSQTAPSDDMVTRFETPEDEL
jgi:formate dehydrogenase iron-sulfur subunit